MADDRRKLGEQVVAIADEIARYSGSPDRVSSAIRACIATLESSSWPEVAWRFSTLNEDGCPVEFAFSSGDNSLRYTAEVAAPELDNHERLAAACGLIRKLQPHTEFSQGFVHWTSMQSGAPLRWGSWLGVREDASGQRLKFYVEMPHEASQKSALAKSLIPDSELLMIGYDLSGQRTEFYFRQPQMSASQAEDFRSRMADKEQGKILLSAFADLCAMPVAAALRFVPFGYSLTCVSESRGPVYTLFVRSRTLGRLSRTRQQFIAYEQRSKRKSCYQSMFDDVPDCELPDHGMVSLTAHEDKVEMRVSLSALALAQLRFRRAATSAAAKS